MRIKLGFLIIFIALFSCKEKSKEFKFNENGISFTCPSGWSIVEKEVTDKGDYYLTIEKDGFDSSGLIVVSCINDSISLNNNIEHYKDGLKENIIYKNSNLVFQPIKIDDFNKRNSYSTKFKFNLIGLKHEGDIYSFYGKSKTYLIFKQGALEDTIKNKTGFNIFEQSFSIE